MISAFDARPIIVAIAGPNGAGKTTFFEAHLRPAGLRFVNADDLSRELSIGAYESARLAELVREELVKQRESFVFETVFSDREGDKLRFLTRAEGLGYTVVLCFVGVKSPAICEERIAMRVLQGGHDVPTEKVTARFPRAIENLVQALEVLKHVLVYDNSDLSRPFRLVAERLGDSPVVMHPPIPKWLGLDGEG